MSEEFRKHPYRFEILFIDDGSVDQTLKILHDIAAQDIHVSVLSLSRNFGHQAAVSCGLEHAKGDAVIIIDVDLQDPPSLISEMILAWESGCQNVYARRIERKGESFFKRASAKSFYRILNSISEVDIPLDTGDFRLLDREVVDAFLRMPERSRFLRGMFPWLGFKQKEVQFIRNERYAGQTKYSMKKMVNLAVDGVLGFSVKPLRMAIWVGLFFSATSFGYSVAALISKILSMGSLLPGYTTIVVLLSFLGGIQLLAIGMIGEYLGRTYLEVKSRPMFIVNERLSLRRK